MKYRQLGRCGLHVSEIGFGTWGLGGSYGPVDDDVSRETLRHALRRGVTFYDTSDLYGDGRAEAVLGEALAGQRGRAVVATKGGMLPHSGFAMPQDFSLTHLRQAFANSLERLHSDYVDVYQLHSPTLADLESNPTVFQWLDRLKRQGRVAAYGVSVRSPADGLAILQRWEVDVLQVNFNLIDQRAVESGLLSRAEALGVGIIARTPLAFGYLSGTMTGREQLPPGDHRANWPVDQLERWASAPRKFAPLNEGTQRSMVQLALQYCISQSAVSTVIPGMFSPEQVDENIAASELGLLSDAELGQSAMIYSENQFFDGGAKSRGVSR